MQAHQSRRFKDRECTLTSTRPLCVPTLPHHESARHNSLLLWFSSDQWSVNKNDHETNAWNEKRKMTGKMTVIVMLDTREVMNLYADQAKQIPRFVCVCVCVCVWGHATAAKGLSIPHCQTTEQHFCHWSNSYIMKSALVSSLIWYICSNLISSCSLSSPTQETSVAFWYNNLT